MLQTTANWMRSLGRYGLVKLTYSLSSFGGGPRMRVMMRR